MTRPDVSVVIPVYRNADALVELHRRLCRALEGEGLGFEILFVDDGCPAGSSSKLWELARRDSRVAALCLAANVGQHRAVLLGLAHARGEWAVVMDGDLQDPPEAIPELLRKGREGPLAVFAGRRGSYESSFRLLTSRLFKGLLHVLCGVPADAGLYVALHRLAVERLLRLGGPCPFVVALIGATGVPSVSVPVVRARRPQGRSAYTAWRRVTSATRAFVWVALWRLGLLRGGGESRWKDVPIRTKVGGRFGDADRDSGVADSALAEEGRNWVMEG